MRSSFITSAADPSGFPEGSGAEFAFFGRSNVGKSTLLNRLAGAKIARVSRTPGRTQLINFFEVTTPKASFRLADLPGYGYAAAPKAVVAQFERIVWGYLEKRSVRAALLLIDIRRELQPDDLSVWAMLRDTVGDRGAELWPVMTKVDKLPKAKRKPAAWAVADRLDVDRAHVISTSAQDQLGIADLAGRLEARALGADAPRA